MFSRVPDFAHNPRFGRSALSVAVVFGVLGFGLPSVVAQETTPPVDPALEAERAAAAAIDQQLQQVSVEIDLLQEDTAEIQAEIDRLGTEIEAAQVKYELELEGQAQSIRDAAAIDDEVEDAQLEVEAWEEILRERAVAAYVSPATRTPEISSVLLSEDVDQLQTKVVLLSAVAETDAEVLEELDASRRRLDQELEAQDELQAEIEAQREQTAAAKDELEEKQAEQEELKAELEEKIAAFQAEADALAAARAELLAIIAEREAFLAQQAQWRADCDAGIIPVDNNGAPVDCATLELLAAPGNLGWPVAGPVSSEFGFRWGRMHEGIDIAANTGAAVFAAEAGIVFFTGWLGGYGNTTMIDHGGGVVTLYAHQSAIWAYEGQTVYRGTSIGAVGSTGNSTGPHMHFEVRVNGAAVNPRIYLG